MLNAILKFNISSIKKTNKFVCTFHRYFALFYELRFLIFTRDVMAPTKGEIKKKILENEYTTKAKAVNKAKRFKSSHSIPAYGKLLTKYSTKTNALVSNFFFCKTCREVIFNDTKQGKLIC